MNRKLRPVPTDRACSGIAHCARGRPCRRCLAADAFNDAWLSPSARRSGPTTGADAVSVCINGILDPFDRALRRIALARELCLPLAMFACAFKMIMALASIGTSSLGDSSSLIGASLWGTVFGVALHVLSTVVEGILRFRVIDLESLLESVGLRP